MLLAGRTPSKFRRFAGISSAPNAADGQSTCARIGRNTARQGMAICKSVAFVERNSLAAGKSRLESMLEFRHGLIILDHGKVIVLALEAGS